MKEELLVKLKEEYKKDNKHKTKEQKIASIIYNHLDSIHPSETNKIFHFIGAVTGIGYYSHYVDKDNSDAKYLIYWDIEQSYAVTIPKEEEKEFNEINTIVYGEVHYDITSDFFSYAIETNQNEAVKKIIKKYSK